MTGNSLVDKILLGVNAVAIIGATALIVYSHSIKKVPTNNSLEFGDMIETSIQENNIAPVSMKEVVVNLYSRERRLRFLNVKMDIGIFNESDRKLLKDASPLIFDQLVDLAGNLQPKELNTVTGKILFESRLKNRINQRIGKNIIKKVYFSKFIIQ